MPRDCTGGCFACYQDEQSSCVAGSHKHTQRMSKFVIATREDIAELSDFSSFGDALSYGTSEFETVGSSTVTSDWVSGVSTVLRDDLSSLLVEVAPEEIGLEVLGPLGLLIGAGILGEEIWRRTRREQNLTPANPPSHPAQWAGASLDQAAPFVELPMLVRLSPRHLRRSGPSRAARRRR